MSFDDVLNEELKNPEFKKEWDGIKEENIIIKNIETVVTNCEEHISLLSKYRECQPASDKLAAEYISKISELRDEWSDALNTIRENGFSPEGRLSYVDVSYRGSYAFVILSGYIKDLCFGLEKLKLRDDYRRFCNSQDVFQTPRA